MKKAYKFEVRQLDSWLYDDEWNINNCYKMGLFETGAKNERKAFTNYLKKRGIVFKKNRTLIEFDGDNYTIIDRKTKEPLFDAILINY